MEQVWTCQCLGIRPAVGHLGPFVMGALQQKLMLAKLRSTSHVCWLVLVQILLKIIEVQKSKDDIVIFIIYGTPENVSSLVFNLA